MIAGASTRGERLYTPRYSYSETDQLARVQRGTARRWLAGYGYRSQGGEQVIQPPVTPSIATSEGVSFLGLIEVAAIGRLREAGLPLPAIRRAVTYCQERLHIPHPLVSARFKTDGREIFVEQSGDLLEVGRRRGQRAWKEFLGPFLQEVDYDEEVAQRWWPLGRAEGVVIDPDYGYGLPVVANSGVRTESIAGQFEAGESVDQIAEDFGVSRDDVCHALRFELLRSA